MHPTFAKLLGGLHPKFEALISLPACRYGSLPKGMPAQGVYLFTENGSHLYVGNTIRARYDRHCNPGARHRMAAFAFSSVARPLAK